MTSSFSSQPCAAHISQPASQAPFSGPWIAVELVSGTPLYLQASCERSFDPHESSVVLGSESAIGEPLARGCGQYVTKSGRVIDLPLIVSEHLLVDVAIQMNRGDGHVSTFQRPLQQTPEVLQAIGVDLTDDVFINVVDAGVEVVQGQTAIGGGRVRVDAGIELHIASNRRLQGVVVRIGDYLGTKFAAALQQALYDRLADWAASFDRIGPLGLMHILGLTANERLVAFHFARQLAESSGLHGQSNAVEHEPRRLLGDFEVASEFAGADAVLGVGDTPDGDEPLVEAQGRVLEDGSNLDAELLSAVLRLALKQRPRPHDANLIAAALRAGDYPVGILGPEHGLEAHLGVGEVADSGEQ